MITKLQWSSYGPLNSATNFTNQRRTQNIFGFSIFERQEQKQTKQNLFGFSNSKLTRRLSKPKTKNQRDNQRETTEIFLVFLFFGKQEQNKNSKRKKGRKRNMDIQ